LKNNFFNEKINKLSNEHTKLTNLSSWHEQKLAQIVTELKLTFKTDNGMRLLEIMQIN